MKVRDIIRDVQAAGWRYIGSTGGHRHYEHPSRAGKVTVAGQMNDDLPPKTIASIRRQAGLRK